MQTPITRNYRRRASSVRQSTPLSRQGWTVVAMAVVCSFGGGSARPDVLSLLYLRPSLILGILLLWGMGGADHNAAQVKWPLLLFGLSAASVAMQMVPLPPTVWLALSGHAQFADAAAIGGLSQPWRPISLAPMYTANSLLALIPAAAGLYGGLLLAPDDKARVIDTILLIGLGSALLGVLQVGGGDVAYTYAETSLGLPVGLFANRNHQAALLALSIPLVALWAGRPAIGIPNRFRPWIAAGITFFLLVMLLITGSRAGLALGGIGCLFMVYAVPATSRSPNRNWTIRWAAAISSILILALALALLSGRALAVQRLFSLTASADEQRLNELPTLIHMAGKFMPFGIGYGAFDPAFRVFETDSALSYTYFNHAHNDFIELSITGGLPAVALMAMALVYTIYRSKNIFYNRFINGNRIRRVEMSALTVIIILTIASTIDYPLRTPLLSFIFSVCFAIICGDDGRARASQSGPALVNGAADG